MESTGKLAGQSTYGATIGILVGAFYCGEAYCALPDSVTSLGDTIRNSGGRGFAVDTAGAAVIDSLVVAGTGQDSSTSGGFGVDLQRGGKYTLSRGHISNTLGDNAVNVCGDRTVLRTRGNHIAGAGNNGISAYAWCSATGPDSVISVADTILDSYESGIHTNYVRYTLVDSAVVDSVGNFNGIETLNSGFMRVQRSSFRRAYNAGVHGSSVNHVEVLRNTLVGNGSNGLSLHNLVDTAMIYGNSVDSSGYTGIWLEGGLNAVADSNRVTNSGTNGILFEAGSGGLVTRSRFERSQWWGVQAYNNYAVSPVVRRSIIQLSVLGGAANFLPSGAVLDADSNYWGDAHGPRCGSGILGCDISVVSGDTAVLSKAGDSITTPGVLFANWLTSAPAVVPAPPFRSQVAASPNRPRPASGVVMSGAGAQRSASGVGSASQRPGVARVPARRPLTLLRRRCGLPGRSHRHGTEARERERHGCAADPDCAPASFQPGSAKSLSGFLLADCRWAAFGRALLDEPSVAR